MTDSSPDGTLRLERTVRVPETVSSHAQAAMAVGSAMVADRLAHPQAMPARDDAAAWKARIAEMDTAIITGFAASAADLPASVEATRIALKTAPLPEAQPIGRLAPIPNRWAE